MFEQALLVGPQHSTRGAAFALSISAQIALLGAAMAIPLFLVEGPSVAKLTLLLMAPPPPPPPPAPIKLVEVPARVYRSLSDGARLFVPARIPTKVADIVDNELPPAVDVFAPMRTGVPGGVPGGTGIPGGVGQQTFVLPPPAEAQPPRQATPAVAVETPVQRVNVGGIVQSAKLVNKVVPPYPPLAKAARVQGTVRLMGIISREGRIMQLQILSGHPLLATAAVDAVRQWVYQPTLLNGQPVEVIAPIDVHFTLSN